MSLNLMCRQVLCCVACCLSGTALASRHGSNGGRKIALIFMRVDCRVRLLFCNDPPQAAVDFAEDTM